MRHKRTHLEVLSETNQALKVRRALLQLSVTEIPGLGAPGGGDTGWKGP